MPDTVPATESRQTRFVRRHPNTNEKNNPAMLDFKWSPRASSPKNDKEEKKHEAIDRVCEKVLHHRRQRQVSGRGALFNLCELVSQRRSAGARSIQLPRNDRGARL